MGNIFDEAYKLTGVGMVANAQKSEGHTDDYWNSRYYEDYVKYAREQGLPESEIMSKSQYVNKLGPDQQKDGNARTINSTVDARVAEIKQKSAEEANMAAEKSSFLTKLDEILSDTKYTPGKFDPSGATTTTWFDMLNKAEKPAEDLAIKKTNEQANFVNPYATGGGNQLRATNELIQNITGDRMSRAISAASTEFAREENARATDLAQTRAQKIGATDMFLKRGWGQEDAAAARAEATAARERDALYAAQLAEYYKPKPTEWYNTPIAQTVVSGLVRGGVAAATGGLSEASPAVSKIAKYGQLAG